jgi:glutathione S-transferase
MIVLYGFGPAFGLPDASPFVMKTEVQLKMSGLPYRLDLSAPLHGPKGKIPYIEDDGRRLGDSTFIRKYLAVQHGIDLDRTLSPQQRAFCWALERMLEDHLYWAIAHLRWTLDENFAKGPAHFFDRLPEAMRDSARQQARERFQAALHGQGLGRHSAEEVAELGETSLSALSVLLGDQPYLLGAEPCAADATVFGMMAAVLAPLFDAPLVRAAHGLKNLVTYTDRMMRRYYPEFAWQLRESDHDGTILGC